MARTGRPADRQVGAVHRAVAVLDTLADAGGELGTNEIARRTGINVSSVSRLLSTLASTGLVAYADATGRYRLGVHLLRLAGAARESLDIRALARPCLQALVGITGETVTLSLPGESDAVTVDFIQSPLSVRSVTQVGRRSVAHATSVGKVFLGHGGHVPEGPLPAYTERTVTDRRLVEAEASRARQRGWAIAVGEREPDLNAVAAPVLGPGGRLAAILGVQGPAGRFTREAMDAAVTPLLDQARGLASSL